MKKNHNTENVKNAKNTKSAKNCGGRCSGTKDCD